MFKEPTYAVIRCVEIAVSNHETGCYCLLVKTCIWTSWLDRLSATSGALNLRSLTVTWETQMMNELGCIFKRQFLRVLFCSHQYQTQSLDSSFMKMNKNKCKLTLGIITSSWETVKVKRTVILPEQQFHNETTFQSTCYISLQMLFYTVVWDQCITDAFHVSAKKCLNHWCLRGASCTLQRMNGNTRR